MDARYQQKVSLLFQSKLKFIEPFKIREEEWLDDPNKCLQLNLGRYIHTYLSLQAELQIQKGEIKKLQELAIIQLLYKV